MKQTQIIASLTLAVAGVATTLAAGASEWQLGAASKVGFSFSQQGTKYSGRFNTFTANINIDPANVEGGSIVGTVQTDSVNTRDYDRDSTLTDGDWFDSSNYPEATFESTSISADGEGGYVAAGTLTLKGTSKPATMNFTFDAGDTSAEFAATMKVNRFDFN
ncbi:MAG: YceI family protein, partial [Gammaproteobacteria bacterium]